MLRYFFGSWHCMWICCPRRTLLPYSYLFAYIIVRYCSPATRAQIVGFLDLGLSTYEVAKRIKRHPTTVSRVYKRYQQNQDFYHSKPKPGRPRKLTHSDVHFAALLLAQGKARNIVELQQKYFPNASAETLRQRLRDFGLHGRVRRSIREKGGIW